MMDNQFHEFRYVIHLKDYDEGVFFFREVLGLQPNYTWSIVPDNQGYRFYMGRGRMEIVCYPFGPRQGSGEISAECRDLALCMERMLDEMPDVKILRRSSTEVVIEGMNRSRIRLFQGDRNQEAGGVIEKTNMFTGDFTGILYEPDLTSAASFYRDYIGLPVIEERSSEGSVTFDAGDAYLEIREGGDGMGPSMIALEAESVNRLHEKLCRDERYREVFVLHDTDFDARRFFQILDPGGNVVEFYSYLYKVREEILLH